MQREKRNRFKRCQKENALSSKCCSKVDQWETWNILGKLEQENKKGSRSWKLSETRRDQGIVLQK
jgi:hypothetical protein